MTRDHGKWGYAWSLKYKYFYFWWGKDKYVGLMALKKQYQYWGRLRWHEGIAHSFGLGPLGHIYYH